MFRFRTTWGLALGFFGVVYITWLYLAWLAGYLELQRHMSIPKTGLVAAIPFAFGAVGSIGGGWIADWLMRLWLAPVASREVPVVAGLLGMGAFTVVAAETDRDFVAVAANSGALMFGAAASGMSWALASVAAPGNRTASLGAIQSFGGYLGGALAATVTGFIVQEASCRRCWRVRRSGWYRHLPILLSFARNRLQSPSLTPSLACGR